MRQKLTNVALKMLKTLFKEHIESASEVNEFGKTFIVNDKDNILIVAAGWISQKMANLLIDELDNNEPVENAETYVVELQKGTFVIVTEVRMHTMIICDDWVDEMKDFAHRINQLICTRYGAGLQLNALRNDLHGTFNALDEYIRTPKPEPEGYDPD